MSCGEDINNDLTSENMEQENKVQIEEASVNFGYVKKELYEEELEFDENQYKIALNFQNIFEESWIEQRNNRDSLIGFLDGDVIMQTGSVKEGNKKLVRKTLEQSHCNKCGGNYQGYCLNCSSLSHILNNLTPNLNLEPVLNTAPINILEIRVVSTRQAVFALKTLPKCIILGPFEGAAPIESTTGLQWKIKDKKLVTDQNGNWMKYIESVRNHASKNLDVFQINGILYFETSREIQEGEELLVYYGVENEVLDSDKEEEFYLVPVKKEEYPKVFACTLCCLGFRLEMYLMDHKKKCSQDNHRSSIEDFEIIQCRCCKVWLEEQEHLGSHMLHCVENYNRLRHNIPNSQRKPADEINETQGRIDVMDSKYLNGIGKAYKKGCFTEKKHKCSKCSYQANYKSILKIHLNTHNDIKPFECDICKKGFTQKSNLKFHIINQHSNASEKEHKDSLKLHFNANTEIKLFECDICKKRFRHKSSLKTHIIAIHSNTSEKEYKCSECPYQTNHKTSIKRHINTHNDIKEFVCDICKNRFARKSNLKLHIRNRHSNTSEKDYKCSQCSYQTNDMRNLKRHFNTHNNNKDMPFACDVCDKRFRQKDKLILHVRDKHSNANEKEYKCSECSYQTMYKHSIKVHLNTHVKPFVCEICKRRFGDESNLKIHIRNVHSNTSEKEYKCSECSYQTNRKDHLKGHLNVHNEISLFECDICKKRFREKSNLKKHITIIHSNTGEKKYKCSDCSFETMYKNCLKVHFNTHNNSNDIKAFECEICKNTFTHKSSLQKHIRNQHSNTSEKAYKCPVCFYQTNCKHHLEVHLNIHTGVKSFECDICKKRFSRKSGAKRHMKTQHSNISEMERAPSVLIEQI